MKKEYGLPYLFAVGILTALLLSGCGQKSAADGETEALKEQVAQLEQQLQELKLKAEENQKTLDAAPQEAPSSQTLPLENNPAAPQEEAPPAEPAPEQENPSHGGTENAGGEDAVGASNLKTTDTLEALETLVAAFEDKANAATANGSASENMEQFFSLKQEEKQIDDKLDLHEDELEYLYRKQSLTREDYNRMDRQLERLEDRLDDAEDYLELVFGIDD